MVICVEQGADLHMAQLMPLPLTVSCSSKIQIGFTLLVPADLGTPRKRAVKRVCVCVCVCVCACVRACVHACVRVCIKLSILLVLFYDYNIAVILRVYLVDFECRLSIRQPPSLGPSHLELGCKLTHRLLLLPCPPSPFVAVTCYPV